MTTSEKINDMRMRLGFDERHFAKLIEVQPNLISKWEKGICAPTQDEIDLIRDTFNLDHSFFEREDATVPTLTARKKLDTRKYKNTLSTYGEVLKEYFSNPWRVYVLAKFKQRNKLENIIDILFNNSKEALMNEMESFAPCYLALKDDIKLIVSITTEYLEVKEVTIDTNEKRFVYDGYRYVKANEIDLK